MQVINYLSKYVASEAAAVEEKKADLSAPEGFALMQRKKEDDQDAWMLGKGAGGKKGAKGKKVGRVAGYFLFCEWMYAPFQWVLDAWEGRCLM